jgi:hypothetical protein
MLNPFFLQGSKSEQGLIQDLINEQLRMYGVEVYYLPRKYLTQKTSIREVIESKFDIAYPIEAYVENYDGYGDNTTILSKFGIQALNELSITISRERFENYITPLIKGQSNIKLSSRPKEGDIIYFPLGDRLFEIKFVEHEKPFYQLQKNYVYQLKCELFRYEDEVINTGIEDIDDNISGTSDSGSGSSSGLIRSFTMSGIGVTATAITTLSYGGIRYFDVTNRGGGYSYAPRVAISSAPSGGMTGVGTAIMIGGIVVCTDNTNPNLKSVQSVQVVNPGYGYTQPPSVAFFGDGVGAAATAIIGDGIVGIVTITNSGGGYSLPPTITFNGNCTVSAAATAVVSSAGTITSIRLTNAGLGYTETPSITVSPPPISGIGTYLFNETVIGSITGTTGIVKSWNSVTNKLELSNITGSFAIGEELVGSASSTSRTLRTADSFYNDNGYASNDEIETDADKIIDFSEINPFGTP